MTSLRLALITTVLTSLGVAASAQTPAPTPAPMPFCPEGAVIIVDGMRECQIADSLKKLISDFETADTTDPISAGSEGDRVALRKLPDVTPENSPLPMTAVFLTS